jgi:hypothetical protein
VTGVSVLPDLGETVRPGRPFAQEPSPLERYETAQSEPQNALSKCMY